MPTDPRRTPFEGEALLIWSHAGLRPLAFGAVHYVGTPHGPGIDLVVATLAPGRRPKMVGRVLASGGRGVEPPGRVAWVVRDRVREIHWHDGGLKIWAGIGGRSVPVPVPGWLLRDGRGGDGSLPTRVFMVHLEMVVPADSELTVFAGRRHGLLFSTARLAGDPPRLRIPLPKRAEAAPEPS
ncbi:MAG: hypothetical protein ACRDZ3_01270 [Acidimicrobiia bacterium]